MLGSCGSHPGLGPIFLIKALGCLAGLGGLGWSSLAAVLPQPPGALL